jgi:hypothetical protein
MKQLGKSHDGVLDSRFDAVEELVALHARTCNHMANDQDHWAHDHTNTSWTGCMDLFIVRTSHTSIHATELKKTDYSARMAPNHSHALYAFLVHPYRISRRQKETLYLLR